MSPAGAKQSEVEGTLLSPAEVDEHLAYLQFLDPRKSWERLDVFAKWLIASSALVGTVGSGFSSRMFSELSGWGEWLFAFAIILVGISLGMAVFALSPGSRPSQFNPNDTEGMIELLDKALVKRQRRLFVSAASLACALLAAALAPFASTAGSLLAVEEAALGFTFDQEENLLVSVEAHGIRPYTPVTLHVHIASGGLSRGPLLGTGQAVATEDGRIDTTVRIPRERYKAQRQLLAVASWPPPAGSGGHLREASTRIDIPAQ